MVHFSCGHLDLVFALASHVYQCKSKCKQAETQTQAKIGDHALYVRDRLGSRLDWPGNTFHPEFRILDFRSLTGNILYR